MRSHTASTKGKFEQLSRGMAKNDSETSHPLALGDVAVAVVEPSLWLNQSWPRIGQVEDCADQNWAGSDQIWAGLDHVVVGFVHNCGDAAWVGARFDQVWVGCPFEGWFRPFGVISADIGWV